jgi:AraC-like DNA-binding protein
MKFDEAPLRHVNIGYVRVLFDHLRQVGMQPEEIAARGYVEQIEQLDSFARCPLRDWEALMARAETVLDDPELALRLAEAIKPWHTGLVGYMIMTSRVLSDVGGVLLRFEHLLNDVNQINFDVQPQRFRMMLQPGACKVSRRLALLSIGSWAWHSRWLTGQPELVFDAAFEFEEPADLSCYRHAFGGLLRFNQPHAEMSARSDYLELRVIQQDPNIHRVLRQVAFTQLEALSSNSSGFLARLEEAIKRRLDTGELSLEAVAEDMNIATRRLQNRLNDYGMTFRSMVDGVRRSQAKAYLDDGKFSISEIALMLGFSTQTSFQHAFKRWTGQTPGRYRRKALPRSQLISA